MIKIINWNTLSDSGKEQILERPIMTNDPSQQVSEIISQVRTQGDSALLDLTEKLDGVVLDSIQVEPEAISEAIIEDNALEAIVQATDTITRYHQAVLPCSQTIETAPGIIIDKQYRPIEKVGLYVPGGNNTPLISSLLMQAIPAKIAGCPLRVLCTPPDKTGGIDPHLLVAARICGISTIYKLGGAQAIAALAYGTETVIKMDKLFGPGNRFVTEAKTQVSIDPKGAAIDIPAGPSEVMVVADKWANPEFVAADLLAQAEHGCDSQVILLCEEEAFACSVQTALSRQIYEMPKQAIIRQSLGIGSIIVCKSVKEQLAIINRYAPEHLIINREDARDWLNEIKSAGTVFLGPWAAESMGDYITGSNHVLPTFGYAKTHSGLSTADFMKSMTIQSIDKAGLLGLGEYAMRLAKLENLQAHANAIQLRIDSVYAGE
ncbi:histidinol dehydrogenase [Legionella sp. 16cNR16C]|uniref:histidinol dehydrogenase n=1 Tax=Legionella sp. 16cNR16C TaxID=2905656 RepID=UPI001E3CECE0|nr:histidinol dehydrogenase [Legionella sp. 16cNR16C]MCE3044876.1 histidinol dehydrogenase [Legionella sp. 16cNR16C]